MMPADTLGHLGASGTPCAFKLGEAASATHFVLEHACHLLCGPIIDAALL